MASNKSKLETPEYKERLLVFSERLKKERGKLGITQAKLAERAGLSGHAVISRWEAVADEKRGGDYSSAGAVARELPDVNDMLKLCDVFGCEIAYLVGAQKMPTKELTDVCRFTGLDGISAENLNAWKKQSEPTINGGYVTTTGGNVHAQGVLNFVNALICSNQIDRLAGLARSYSDHMGRCIDEVGIVAHLADAINEAMAAGREPETRLVERDFEKAISGSNLMFEEAGKYEYMMIKLLGVFLEDYAGHDEKELRALQNKVRELQKIVLEGGE